MIGEDQPDQLALLVLWHNSDCIAQVRQDGGIGFWGGKIKGGEKPVEAAYREGGEEINLGFEEMLRENKALRSMGDEIETDGFVIHAFQAHFGYSGVLGKITEGSSVVMSPMDMWHHDKLMVASKAVIKEFILKPNGFIDN